MAKLISKTYGEALFKLAIEEQKTELFFKEIQCIFEILEENKNFQVLMNHPEISKEEKIKMIEIVFKDRVSIELVGFLTLIVAKDRYNELDAILKYFIAKIKELKGIGIAYVTSAVSLEEQQKQLIEKKLIETTTFGEMEMHYANDSSLIGGMVIRIGDRVVDSSIRSKLLNLEKQLMKIQLKN